MNEHLGEHKVPTKGDEPMEEPEEAGAGARSPSPEYGDTMEAKALMKEAEETGARARSSIPEYMALGSPSLSLRRTTSPRRLIRVYMLYRYTIEGGGARRVPAWRQGFGSKK